MSIDDVWVGDFVNPLKSPVSKRRWPTSAEIPSSVPVIVAILATADIMNSVYAASVAKTQVAFAASAAQTGSTSTVCTVEDEREH
jgi:hypothetical protein